MPRIRNVDKDSDERSNSTFDPEIHTQSILTTLRNGLLILESFSSTERRLTISELAVKTGVPKTKASRLVATLVQSGYLRKVDNEYTYALGAKLIALGLNAEGEVDLRRAARGPLEELAAITGETSHVGILSEGWVVTLMVIPGSHSVRMHSAPGKRSPVLASAMGKVIAANSDSVSLDFLRGQGSLGSHHRQLQDELVIKKEFQQIRLLGYALESDEVELGLSCVSAPIFDASGSVVAGIASAMPTSRLLDWSMEVLVDHVRNAASEISAKMGFADGSAIASELLRSNQSGEINKESANC